MISMTSVLAVVLPSKARLKNSPAREVASAGLPQWFALYMWKPIRSGTPSAFHTGLAAHEESASQVPPRWHHEFLPLAFEKCSKYRGAIVARSKWVSNGSVFTLAGADTSH